MAGKRAEAESISKWLGSLGEIGSPPGYYHIAEAAKELGCSFIELAEHPEMTRLMRIAFTLKRGRNEGEYLKQVNPEYHLQLTEMGKAIQAAKK